jgi:SGNH hydrolase-like domain, acetyltransferase AlgX
MLDPVRANPFAAVALVCTLMAACSKREPTVVPSVPAPAMPAAPAPSAPQLPVSRPPEPREPEPRAIEERANAIRSTADAIRSECETAAGGNWERWQRETAPYRTALKARLDALKTFDPPPAQWFDCRYEPLEGKDKFPLFEVSAREYLQYLHDPASFDTFRKERPVVAVNRWLRQRGIDLIFVSIPKMTEVYIEHFLDSCPADGVIAPHVRRVLLDLLDEDVEVIDGFPLFRALRDTDTEYLYNTADPHWAARAMRIMAKKLADRVARYRFGARARFGAPIVKTAPGTFYIPGAPVEGHIGELTSQFGWPALTPEQQARAAKAQTKFTTHVTLADGREPPDDPQSPVVVIGNSYMIRFREQLIKELNLLIQTRWRENATTDSFAEFIREPKSLESCRVMIWITTDQCIPWFRPLPAPIAAAAVSK